MIGSRIKICVRVASAALLLALLGVCGYMGSYRAPVQTVSVPVSRQTISGADVAQATMEQTRARLRGEREQELALLTSVLEDPTATEETKNQALSQRRQIAARMELEAGTEAVLSYMGYGDAAVVCGAQRVTVIVPAELAAQEQARLRIIDAAASQAGLSPEAVKIILAKK